MKRDSFSVAIISDQPLAQAARGGGHGACGHHGRRGYVGAGFTKIHLDASMACGDDLSHPSDELLAAFDLAGRERMLEPKEQIAVHNRRTLYQTEGLGVCVRKL
jgi:hypothetical protein